MSDELREDLRERHQEWRDETLAEHKQRRCGSCRDFRASDTPGRGWCINSHAFPTRQLVSQDDLACLSLLGNWWVASDQHWLEKVGVLPTEPTPLTDGLIQLLKESHRQRRRS
jgi:hypothetical protein